MKTLTIREKMMNMAKLGIVSAAGIYFHLLGKWLKQRAGGMTRYTLCVFQDGTRRNSSRNSFAFDIPAISGKSPRSDIPHLRDADWPAEKVAVLVPLQLITKSAEFCFTTQSAASLLRSPHSGRFTPSKNYSTFKRRISGQFLVAGRLS